MRGSLSEWTAVPLRVELLGHDVGGGTGIEECAGDDDLLSKLEVDISGGLGIKNHTAIPVSRSSEARRVKCALAQDEVSLESLVKSDDSWLIHPDTINSNGEDEGPFAGVSFPSQLAVRVLAAWIT